LHHLELEIRFLCNLLRFGKGSQRPTKKIQQKMGAIAKAQLSIPSGACAAAALNTARQIPRAKLDKSSGKTQ
jgi:hypothetical protein